MKSYGLAADLMTLWFQAPLVIASRVGLFGSGPASAVKAQAEMTRMVTEKAAAAAESMVALQFAFANEMMRGFLHPLRKPSSAASERILAKSLRPYGKRVRANARRLAR